MLTERFIEKKSSNSIRVCKADPKKGLYNSISTMFAHAAFQSAFSTHRSSRFSDEKLRSTYFRGSKSKPSLL